ncbi:MAG: heme-binding protein, partial [Bacteroidetes bacterium]
PDGSDFEVYAAGLRNTHEFVFDEYGNLISSDNDGDHSGESERLVHVVEGSDAGWRSNWQYGKYTDPGNNGYNVWMDEKLYVPHWEGQAAYIVPPIMNYHNGPTGMVYNPGTALGSAWKNKFFLVEFVGNPGSSHIWSFGLKPKGASFELSGEQDVVSGILPTGIRFGADGALYAADWITGWDTKNYGRVWKIDVAADKNDLAAQRKETERLMKLDYAKQTEEELSNLLGNDDMRIRQKAQFELVNRGKKGFAVFKQATAQQDKQLKRVHGVWGIGQMARKDKSYAAALVDLLQDGDAEIVAQAVKTLGDIRHTEAAGRLVTLLSQPQPRVQFFAAQSLGRMAHSEAIPALISMLETNNDQDLYLRHAAVLALSRMGQEAPMTALVNHPSKALRTAAVLVLRRLRSPKVADFLKDSDEYIVTEAARAINDDLSIEAALPALAATLADPRFTSEALLRRGINACLRVGSDKEMDLLIAFAGRKDISATLQTEALATLGSWAAPSVLDRVDGRYRTKITRDPAPIAAKVKAAAAPFLQNANPAIVSAAVKMLGALGVSDFNSNLAALMQHRDASVRSAALLALHTLKYEGLETVIKKGMEDRDGSVRTTAIGLLGELETTAASLPGIVDPIFKRGTVPEQQQLLQVLGKMPAEKNEAVLEKLIAQFKAKQLAPALALDLGDAVDSTGNERLIAQLAPLRATGTSLDAYKEALYGGNREAGIRYFFTANSAAQCIRCHAAWGQGGKVGPSLTNIGNTLTREQILQALIEPSARLAPGYGTVVLTLDDGQVVSGVLSEERADELILKTNSAEPLEVPLARIKKRENMPSSMPPMGAVMTKREIRDVVEFLSGMK